MSEAGADTLTVATFNLLYGGLETGLPMEATLAALAELKADVIALQETRASGPEGPGRGRDLGRELAGLLGLHLAEQRVRAPGSLDDVAVLTRHPVAAVSANGLCVVLETPLGALALANWHGAPAPYQPYQLLGVAYGPGRFIATGAEAVAEAEAARGAGLDAVLAALDEVGRGLPAIVAGDFNEPSHLDWSAEAAAAGLVPVAAAFPQTRKLARAGFTDAWRWRHPDPCARPGATWPAGVPADRAKAPENRAERIDFLHLRGLEPRDAWIVGEAEGAADLVVSPWPSDHRSVVARLSLPR